jgi:uncharacterized protein (DUF305 family)
MKLSAVLIAATLALGFALPAFPQSAGAPPSEIDAPEACRGATQGMPNMAHSLSASMANMSAAQKAYLEALVKMPLTTGVMIKDPDVAFVCMMIPHYQGAIDVAHVVLKYGKDAEIKRMAEAAIATQEKQISEIKAWLIQKSSTSAPGNSPPPSK